MKRLLYILSALILPMCFCSASDSPKVSAQVNSKGLFVGGKPVHVLAGEVHYFRVMPEQWRDRLEKLRACGLNTVSTYCPWNAHEPREGEFNFEGRYDLAAFLKLCKEMGLYVMVRPGPYICSEWDFGGLPAWLLTKENTVLRSSNKSFLDAYMGYFKRIMKETEPYFCNNGGTVIAIQIENGYASYGNEMKYLEFLRDAVKKTGFDGIIYTADGDSDVRINAENPEGVWRTLMIGYDLGKGVDVMEKVQPNMPQMISEWWVGQGLLLGKPMRVRPYEKMAKELDAVLARGVHVSCYMFHGGTNFGLTNGALRDVPASKKYTPFISSYDVDAMLTEAGDPTPKYFAFREVFLKYNPDAKKYAVPSATKKASYGKIEFTEIAPMTENLDALTVKRHKGEKMLTMEQLGQYYGFVAYESRMRPQSFPVPVELRGIRDRAFVFLDGELKAVFDQNTENSSVVLDIPASGADLLILAESMGRVNFGLTIEDNLKGITGGVVLNKQQFQNDWLTRSMPLESLSELKWREIGGGEKYPAFLRGKFKVDDVADTFLSFEKGTRGYCWINGKLLGRYDNTSPLLSTFVPAQWLKKGENTLEILEFSGMSEFRADSETTRVKNVKGKRVVE